MSFLVCVCLLLSLNSVQTKVLFKRNVGDYVLVFEAQEDHNSEEDEGSASGVAARVGSFSYGPYIRPGSATETNSCKRIRGVPARLRSSTNMGPKGLTDFYQKYTEAYNIPVVSSSRVPDDALRRACYVLRFMMADHSEIRKSFYHYSGRVGVMAVTEYTTNIPEHSHLDPVFWNARARGLGATTAYPISTGAEENILCYGYPKDAYSDEDIFLHEFAHGVHLLGAMYAISGWDARLQALYTRSKSDGQRWANTYAMSSYQEYFAEGVQSFFGVNAYSAQANGVHNHVDTREKLIGYDPDLYALIKEVFPCGNTFIKRCEKSRSRELNQELKMNCNTNTPDPNSDPNCKDDNAGCGPWANSGECSKNPAYMHMSCKKSCNKCN